MMMIQLLQDRLASLKKEAKAIENKYQELSGRILELDVTIQALQVMDAMPSMPPPPPQPGEPVG